MTQQLSESRATSICSISIARHVYIEFAAVYLELRYFGGLSLDETALAIDASVATVERDWQAARAWLLAQLKGGSGRDA